MKRVNLCAIGILVVILLFFSKGLNEQVEYPKVSIVPPNAVALGKFETFC